MSSDRGFLSGDGRELIAAIKTRIASNAFATQNTIIASHHAISRGTDEIYEWIAEQQVVRVIGAGRTLLAAAIPANRLAHAGARVYVLHDMTPLPNTAKGGAILAASASGRTDSVLQVMRIARRRNPAIRILGIAAEDATEFEDLCDVFIGISEAPNPHQNPLKALADTNEYVISELLDAMVVAAAKRAGLTERQLREGHEDLGDTGPYLPEDSQR